MTVDTDDLLKQLNIKGEDKIEATAAFTILALFGTTAALAGFFKPIMFTVGHGVGAFCGLLAMCVWGGRGVRVDAVARGHGRKCPPFSCRLTPPRSSFFPLLIPRLDYHRVPPLLSRAIFASFVEEDVIDDTAARRSDVEYDASFGLVVVAWLMNAVAAILTLLPATKPE